MFLYSWLLPFLIRGNKTELTEDNIYRHRTKHDSSRLGDKLEAAWNKEVQTQKDPSLARAIRNVFAFECLLMHALAFAVEGGR